MVTIFVLKTFIYTRCRWNYLLLTGRHLCHYLMERIMALHKSLTVYFIDFDQFLPGVNFVCGT